MRELALFAGMGGGILGGKLLGWNTVCAVEINEYCRRVLMQRQDDGILEPFPIWDDITTFDGKPWAGCVDIVTGGFPCQDISAAGKGSGIDGTRSGLWREMARVIGEVRPRYVLVENSPVLTVRGLGTVLGDLAALGYDAEWGVLGAADLGAPHKRDRIWIVAPAHGSRPERRPGERPGVFSAEGSEGPDDYPDRSNPAMANPRSGRRGRPQGGEMELSRGTEALGASDDVAHTTSKRPFPAAQAGIHRSEESAGPWHEQPERCGSTMAHTHGPRLAERQSLTGDDGSQQSPAFGNHRTYPDWPADPAETPESRVGRVVDGCPARVDRLKALGNGQVPRVAAAAFTALAGRLNDS